MSQANSIFSENLLDSAEASIPALIGEKREGGNLPEQPNQKKSKFEVKQKSFLLTYAQSGNLTKEEILDALLAKGAAVVVVAQEHHKSGDIHHHAWVEFESVKHIRDCNYFDVGDRHANIGKVRNAARNTRANAIPYITKEDKEPACFGIDVSAYLEAKKKHRAYIGEALIKGEKSLPEIVQEFPQELYNLDKLHKNLSLYKVLNKEVKPHVERKNFWIYGIPGVGKSYCVRMAFPIFYSKPCNKWWDGYSGEEKVLIDDFDKNHQVLGHHLKIWGDNYSFTAEIKGGQIYPTYDQLVITSNYSPREIFGKDEMLCAAIERRFRVIHMTSRDEQEEIKLLLTGQLFSQRHFLLSIRKREDGSISSYKL